MLTPRHTYIRLLFLISLIVCILLPNISTFVFAKDTNSKYKTILVDQLNTNYSSNKIEQLIQEGETLLKKLPPNSNNVATIHTNLAYAYHQKGEVSKVIEHLRQAAVIYEKSHDEVRLTAVLVDWAQACNSLGQITKALPLLNKAINLASKNKNNKALAAAWGVLGNSYSLVKNYDKALEAYRNSFKFAEGLDTTYTVTALNNQVNMYLLRAGMYDEQAKLAEDEGDTQEPERLLNLAREDRTNADINAKRAYKSSLGLNNLSEVKALLNFTRVLPERDHYLQQAKTILATLPDSRNKAYNLIELASYQQDSRAKIDSLEQAISVSNNIGDFRTSSFALGELGNYYEKQKSLAEAVKYTRAAIIAAQRVVALDSLYRWQWQAGRIYNLTGAKSEAIASYKQAIASLQSIRGDIANASVDLQFDVRDEVEQVYRELMALQLDKGQVQEALSISELLKLTELQNFFGDECIEIQNAVKQPSPSNSKVVITTVILNDKTYVILQEGSKVVKYYSVPINSTELQNKVKDFRRRLEYNYTNTYFSLSREFYDLLIKPMEADLEKLNPSSLTFINDGILRNVPMAALHDGKQFLIKKYPIDTTLGFEVKLQKTIPQTQKALIFGLTVEVPPFDELPNVADEVKSIQDIIGGNSYLDKDFTLSNLQNKIQKGNYSIVHIATHGFFSGTAKGTFLQAFDKQISLQEFEEILNKNANSIELLTLSACETAVGDNRSTLGLAGVAARNNVENVLASLWDVDDEDTVLLIEEFYRQLKKPNITKAEALRNAQLLLTRDSHSAMWSAFVLISN